IAIAAHELRNAMTPILGASELALKAASTSGTICSPRVITLLERMQLLARSFMERSTRLLDIGRIEAGNLRLEPSPTDLSAVVLSVARSYEGMASRGHSRLDLEVEAGVMAVVDRLAVEQVVENLVSNAVKFGIGQPVTLRLRSDGLSARLGSRTEGSACRPTSRHGSLAGSNR